MFQLVIANEEINPITPNTHTLGLSPSNRTEIDEMKIATARIPPRPNFFDNAGVRNPPKTAPNPELAMRTPKYFAWTPRVCVIKRMIVDVAREKKNPIEDVVATKRLKGLSFQR